MSDIVISGTGLYTPPEAISNDELVAAFNAYVAEFNRESAGEIAAGRVKELQPSSTEFIIKASGIKSRHVVNKSGILDPEVMAPRLPERPNEELSILAEMAVHAARDAMKAADRSPGNVDAVLCAASNMQRSYPAMAIEVQNALGIEGFGFDMNVACSSATFAIQTAADMIRAGHARAILIVNPEICSGHLNFRDRDSHFIFGDVATAIILERAADARARGAFKIVATKLLTRFSNNIRNNFGFLNRASPEGVGKADKLFVQEGRRVFKDVVPMVAEMITEHLEEHHLRPADIKRFWLHQANRNMNELIAGRVLGREASAAENPIILDEYANTSSAGSIIAFHKYKDDFKPGEKGVICSFGAGYSAGSVIVERAV